MPTVLRVDGFRIVIYLPPREHEPPHVHVWKGGGEAIFDLVSPHRQPTIRGIWQMRTVDAVKAFRIVEEHTEYLLTRWREYHG